MDLLEKYNPDLGKMYMNWGHGGGSNEWFRTFDIHNNLYSGPPLNTSFDEPGMFNYNTHLIVLYNIHPN